MLGDFPKSKLSHLLWFFLGSLPYFVNHIYRSGDGFFFVIHKAIREGERETTQAKKNLSGQKAAS